MADTWDCFYEAYDAVASRFVRSLLTALGTMLGVASLVATVGLASTARARVSASFNPYEATEVDARSTLSGKAALSDLDFAAGNRPRAIHGVVNSGRWWQVDDHQTLLSAKPAADGVDAPLYAADPGAVEGLQLTMQSGRKFDSFAASRGDDVILLSHSLASNLGIISLATPRSVFIGSRSFAVFGIYDDSRRKPEALLGAIVPVQTSLNIWGSTDVDQPSVLVQTAPGAAQVVASQMALAILPNAPTRVSIIAPTDPSKLRSSVDDSVATLLLLLSGVSIVAGIISIATSSLLSVSERISEIGLRGALGATPRLISLQFLTEGLLIGTLGGVLGASAGVIVVTVVAVCSSWTPSMNLWVPLIAPVLGSLAGVVATVYPALKAGRILPVEALRR